MTTECEGGTAGAARKILDRLDALARLSDEPDRLTRFFLSPAHRAAADLVARWMREAGMETRLDPLATVVGRWPGETADAPALLLGSHIDTVRDAGRFDGTLGVVLAIAAVEELARCGRRLPFAIEVLAFGDEEGCRFPVTLTGSRAIAGTLDPSLLEVRDAHGTSLREALAAFGGDPEGVAHARRDPASTLGYLEVHIEQGPVLENAGLPVGVVTGIAGATRGRITVAGRAGHAGTVPMDLRRDALAGAAEIVLATEALARAEPPAVATIGGCTVEPGVGNVVPGRVSLEFDLRAPDDGLRRRLLSRLEHRCAAIAESRGLSVTFEPRHEAPAVRCDRKLSRLLAEAVEARGLPLLELPSGAGHDAMAVADTLPVAMLFLRCRGGLSHHPEEKVTEEDVRIALEVLSDFLVRLAETDGIGGGE